MSQGTALAVPFTRKSARDHGDLSLPKGSRKER